MQVSHVTEVYTELYGLASKAFSVRATPASFQFSVFGFQLKASGLLAISSVPNCMNMDGINELNEQNWF